MYCASRAWYYSIGALEFLALRACAEELFVAAMAGVLLTQEQQGMLDAVAKASVNVGTRMDEAAAAVAALRTATAEPEL